MSRNRGAASKISRQGLVFSVNTKPYIAHWLAIYLPFLFAHAFEPRVALDLATQISKTAA